ncbi:MAG: helix-turn-helix domain-containing protein [Lachnoclostridium sp.]|jgi:transcriptional regulator with XRE-family HTH domain|nr:helix-turn-helix domain-containing protein [Lachnoclostridium sp.]
MTEDISKHIGKCIRVHRSDLCLTQGFLANKAKLTTNYLGQIERGEKNPTLQILEKISIALGIPLSELIMQAENFEEYEATSAQHLQTYSYLRKYSPQTVALMQRFLESIEFR